MLIENIHIESFGKYEDRRFAFSPGINVVYGENESGKTTIHRFIESILEDELSRADVKSYEPWDGRDAFKGSITLCEGDEKVVISKDFSTNTRTQLVIDSSGEIEDDNIYEQPLTSLSSYKFSNFSGNELVSKLKERISNKTTTNSENVNANNTIKEIDQDLLTYRMKSVKDAIIDEQKVIDENTEELAKIHHEQKLLYKHKNRLTARLDKINAELVEVETMLKDENEKHLERIEEKIRENGREIEERQRRKNDLEKYMQINIDDYEAYLGAMNERQQIQEKKDMLKESLDNKNSLGGKEEEACSRGLKFICNEAYYEDFVYEIGQYKHIQKGIDAIINDISDKKNRLKENQKAKDLDINLMEKEFFEAKFSDYVNDINVEEEEEVENVGKLIETRKKQMVGAGFSLATGSFLFVFSHMIFRENLYNIGLDIGIVLILLGLALGYFMLKNQSKISQLKFVNSYRLERKKQDNESHKDSSSGILEKYNCQNIEDFEGKLDRLKEQEQVAQLSLTQIKNLEVEYDKQVSNLSAIRSNIESRTYQCELKSSLEEDTIDAVEEELNNLRNIYIELNQFKKEAAVAAEEIRSLEKIINNLDTRFNNEQYALFKELTYAEIHGLKKEYYEIENEIKTIEDNNLSLPESDNHSISYQELQDNRYELLEEKLQNELILITAINQTTDNEHLINGLMDRKKQFNIFLGEEKILVDQIATLETVREYIDMGLKAVQVSLYPVINKFMNKMLESITKKYKKIEIKDDGQIVLSYRNNKKVPLTNLSLGAIDQIYFVIGICLIEGLYEADKSIPIIIDDAFIQYDIDRFNNVMDVIGKLDRQVIIFSCYIREYEYFTNNNKAFSFINLSEE